MKKFVSNTKKKKNGDNFAKTLIEMFSPRSWTAAIYSTTNGKFALIGALSSAIWFNQLLLLIWLDQLFSGCYRNTATLGDDQKKVGGERERKRDGYRVASG